MASGYGRAPAERRRRGEVSLERRPALDGEGNEMDRRTASGEIRKQMITGERVQSRVDIHYRRKQISKRQHDAGERFLPWKFSLYLIFFLPQSTPTLTSSSTLPHNCCGYYRMRFSSVAVRFMVIVAAI